jgi:multidrug efflux pump
VERAPRRTAGWFRGNGEPMVGIGIVKQSTANTLAVARAVRAEADRIQPLAARGHGARRATTPRCSSRGHCRGLLTLFIACGLVMLVIFLFLGTCAPLIPAVTVPVSLIATFIVLYAFGFSINLLTLLALVLAIGLVVDDAIVVLENIHRRMRDRRTPPGRRRRGTRQVGFAVIATTLVLVAVFVPITFLQATSAGCSANSPSRWRRRCVLGAGGTHPLAGDGWCARTAAHPGE